jgi:NAD(P)-dependent dehydrogenase (short-subunit alcohol dehydrogenase family)
MRDGRTKTFVIFGAAGGIGGAIAKAMAQTGSQVVGADLQPVDEQKDLIFSHCDAASPEGAALSIADTLQRFGHIDGVIHSIGVAAAGPLATLSFGEWNHVMAVNLSSAFLVAQASYAGLKDSGGSLLFIASSSGRNGGTTATGPAYAASKGGMINLVRYLAKEWAPDYIRVNAIAPGPVMTPMMAAAGAESQKLYARSMLTGRLTEPAEIAAMACFLTSDAARSITGAIINQSGGLVLD